VILLHGTFVDEFLIEIVLPLSIFGGLYWWSSRKEKNKRKRKEGVAPAPAVTDGRDDRQP
jgi:hypothetical protein